MPLPTPAPRTLKHTRTIECKGYEREDGLWDIEGHLTDVKTYVHSRRNGGRERQPGEPVHDMWMRLTVDLEFRIHDIETATASSPYDTCGAITPNFKQLIGLTIGRGWRKEIAERVGGVKGCTHLVEMLGPLGTVAYQATARAREERARAERAAGKAPAKRPYQINSCHTYKEDAPAVLERWPEFYTGPR